MGVRTGGVVSMLHHLTAVQLAKKVRDKEVGCVELLEYFLDRCRRYNESVNAIMANFEFLGSIV